jgi:cytochrome c oxidase cbb3-type subunit 4
MNYGVLRGLTTLLVMLAFVGVFAWAWSRRRHAAFTEAANLPLEEDGSEVSK